MEPSELAARAAAEKEGLLADTRGLIWSAFTVMTTLMVVTLAAMFWACSQEVHAFDRGLEAALKGTQDAQSFAAIATFASGIVGSFTKTLSVLLSFLLIFAGAVYILLPIKARYQATAETTAGKGSLESNSPGLIMTSLGVLLAIVALLHSVSVEYRVEGVPQPDHKSSAAAQTTHYDPKEKEKK